jgi:hypothetical protein
MQWTRRNQCPRTFFRRHPALIRVALKLNCLQYVQVLPLLKSMTDLCISAEHLLPLSYSGYSLPPSVTNLRMTVPNEDAFVPVPFILDALAEDPALGVKRFQVFMGPSPFYWNNVDHLDRKPAYNDMVSQLHSRTTTASVDILDEQGYTLQESKHITHYPVSRQTSNRVSSSRN